LKILVISLPLFFQRSADWGGMIGRIGAAPTGPSPGVHIKPSMYVQKLILQRSSDLVRAIRIVADPGCLSRSRIRVFSIPGQKDQKDQKDSGIRIRIKEFKYF
jgi:hypothetical protein